MKRKRKEVIKEAEKIYEDQKRGMGLDKLAIKYKKSQGSINLMLGLVRDPGVQKHYLEGLNINAAYALVGLPLEEQDKFAKRIKEYCPEIVYKEIKARKKELGVGHNRKVSNKIITDVNSAEETAKENVDRKIIPKQKISGNANAREMMDSIRRRAMTIIDGLNEVGLNGRSSILVKQGEILWAELILLSLELEHAEKTVYETTIK